MAPATKLVKTNAVFTRLRASGALSKSLTWFSRQRRIVQEEIQEDIPGFPLLAASLRRDSFSPLAIRRLIFLCWLSVQKTEATLLREVPPAIFINSGLSMAGASALSPPISALAEKRPPVLTSSSPQSGI